jgi:integrase/recombinase XerD
VTLPRCKRVVKRSGLVIHYHRAPGGALTRLPGDPEASAEAHAAWLAADAQIPAATPRPHPHRLDALAAAYLAGRAFRSLRPVTQAHRRAAIHRILEVTSKKTGIRAGMLVAGDILARHIEADIASRTPSVARERWKAWRALLGHAKALKWVAEDVSRAVACGRPKSRPHQAWTATDVAAFRARWPLGTQQRLAIELLYEHAPRRADLVTMGRQHIRAGRLSWRQSKTGDWTAPRALGPGSAAALDAWLATRPGALTFMETRQGTARSAKAFGAWFATACEAAGLSGLSAHGLRHTLGGDAATASDAAINALLGHSSRSSEGATYRAQADIARLAESGEREVASARGGNRSGAGLETAS